MHAAPISIAKGVIDAGTAYSVSHLAEDKNVRVVIGDSLTLQLSVRWYPTTKLPGGWRGYGGHIYASTLIYIFLAFCAGAGVAIVYFRGVDLPKRLKSYGENRFGGAGQELPRYSGYGYGVGGTPPVSTAMGNGFGNGYGFRPTGKKD